MPAIGIGIGANIDDLKRGMADANATVGAAVQDMHARFAQLATAAQQSNDQIVGAFSGLSDIFASFKTILPAAFGSLGAACSRARYPPR
jgi:hypothetical protein